MDIVATLRASMDVTGRDLSGWTYVVYYFGGGFSGLCEKSENERNWRHWGSSLSIYQYFNVFIPVQPLYVSSVT
jgi:hypothetical protein